MQKMAELGVSIEQLKNAIINEDQHEALRLIDQVDELAAELIRRVSQAKGQMSSFELGTGA